MDRDFDSAKLVKAYIKMRDARKDLLQNYEQQDNEIKEQMDFLEAELLELCKATGADSIKTPEGTIIRNLKTRYWSNDWTSFYAFMMEHGVPELLEKRIAQQSMKQFLEENNGLMPKGLNVESKYGVTVRRSK